MKLNSTFWASSALLLPAALAGPTRTSAAPSCTASTITTLCDYKQPGVEFAVAIASKEDCVQYCADRQPCNFAIFVLGNPSTGSGNCWLYPGEDFDAKLGDKNCGDPSMSVLSKPKCTGSPTGPSACAATASPSTIAKVCDYPPPGDCSTGCMASSGASQCLESCFKAKSCSYVVFNPQNQSNSPYASGTCWMYPKGSYDPKAATTCKTPKQFVYKNVCPKPKTF